MVRLIDVYKEYDNGTKALKGVSMRIDDGEFVFLVGPSGSGKSTIIKLITGEIPLTEGRLMVNGYNMMNIRPRQLPAMRRTLGVIFQDFRLIDKKTVWENLTFAKADYEKAIELDGVSVEAYLGLADIYTQRGEYDKAMKILLDGIEKAGENQAIMDKLAEVEKLADGNADPSEDNGITENDVDSVGETLDLRNVSIEYTTAPEAFAGNDGAG